MKAVLGSGTPADTREYIAMAHNLPVYADEFVVDARTNFNKFGELALNITTGKNHRRLTRNAVRKPNSFRQILLTTAGNFSLVQKTSRETTAQALRVIEIELSNAITKLGLTLDRVTVIKRRLENNHGTAGTIYANYLNQHYANVIRLSCCAPASSERTERLRKRTLLAGNCRCDISLARPSLRPSTCSTLTSCQ